MNGYPRRMHARLSSTCPECGGLIQIRNWIYRFAEDGFFICWHCALQRSAGSHTAQDRGRLAERLLEDPKIRALLCKALVTESESEAGTALAAARKLHRKAVAA